MLPSSVQIRYSKGPTITLYDPATILTGLPSPLVIPSVKRAGDTRSVINVDGSPLDTSMDPVLKLTSGPGTSIFSGVGTLRVPELLSDIGYKSDSASPSLLSKTSRIQALYTATELRESGLDSADVIDAVQLRYWGDDYAPEENLYNARLRYRWVELPDEEDYECMRGGRIRERNMTNDVADCMTEVPHSNLTTAMEPRTLLHRDTSVFVKDNDDEYVMAPLAPPELLPPLPPSRLPSVPKPQPPPPPPRLRYWLNQPLDWNMIWDGASALVLDLSFQVKPRARMAKLYVHNTIVPGQVRTLLWSERAGSASHDDEGFVAGVGASSSSGPVQEMNYVPFVRFSTSTVYLVFEDVGMESSDDSSTDSYSVDVSLNGGDAYIGATVQQAAAHIQMTIDLVGVASADVGEHAQAGFKAVLIGCFR